MSMAKINLTHVPYKGGAPQVTALVSGETEASFPTVGTVVSHVRNGKLKALALGSSDLEAVYKQVAFDRLYDDASAVRHLREKKAKEQTQVIQAKRQASVASSGASASSADVSSKPITSLRDAYEAAKRQHA